MTLTRSEALKQLRQSRDTASLATTWTCRVGPFTLRFPNFAWRRRAIAAHDLHHLMTGYPMTMTGEFRMAAWEFSAGRFRHPGATAFCAPLIVAGFVWSPVKMLAAIKAGRDSRSLYCELDQEV